jgi:hypothetical protein
LVKNHVKKGGARNCLNVLHERSELVLGVF